MEYEEEEAHLDGDVGRCLEWEPPCTYEAFHLGDNAESKYLIYNTMGSWEGKQTYL